MPRRRTKTRLEHLADAHGRLLQAQACLSEIDLRTTRGPLRDAVRAARTTTAAALTALETAITHEPPGRPTSRRRDTTAHRGTV